MTAGNSPHSVPGFAEARRGETHRRHRQRLAVLSDAIAPRTATMPSASDIDLVGNLLGDSPGGSHGGSHRDSASMLRGEAAPFNGILQARPDWATPLRAILERMHDDEALTPATASRFVERLSEEDPPACRLLVEIIAGNYYLDQQVRRAIGYGGQADRPLSDTPHFSPGMTAARRRIGTPSRYRPVEE